MAFDRLSGHAARWLIVSMLAALVAGCAVRPAAPPEARGMHHAYVVLGDEGRPMARVITADATCPGIALDGVTQPMRIRAAPAVILPRPAGAVAAVKEAAFPVLTCEIPIAPGVTSAVVAGRTLPLPKPRPRRIVVLGDTGCRMLGFGNVFQGCDVPAAWPFRTVAATAAAMAPDLVIHVGDYHYREDPCPPDNVGCAGSPWGYVSDVWDADLFAPAAPLFAAAPWVVVRGNHESCGRAGVGWWRFLDPRPLAPHQDCVDPADDAVGDYSAPYAVPLDAEGEAQLIVFDSSAVGLKALAPADLMYRNYRAELEQAFARVAQRPQAFFLVHHPILGFAPNPGRPASPFPGNAGLQSVLQSLVPGTLFPPGVQAVLSGHVHNFEVVNFASAHPPQIISGAGGVWLDERFPVPFPPNARPAPGVVMDGIVSSAAFGFMLMEREDARWRMTAFDTRGATITVCELVARKIACTPTGGS